MNKFKFLPKKNRDNLPKTSGVYAFKNDEDLIYIGKAANIQSRVKNHFQQPSYRDALFINKVKQVGYFKTDSEIEALIIEAVLIKKYQPKFNIVWKDDKNYFWVAISDLENRPVVFITHQPENFPPSGDLPQGDKFSYIGPFVDGKALKQTLRILRRIFPFYSVKKHPPKLCPYCHLGLCPGPEPDLKEYKNNIKNLIAFLKGRKKSVLNNLKKEMFAFSKENNFEKAAKIRDEIFALENVLSHAKILQPTEPRNYPWNYEKIEHKLKKLLKINKDISRIEGYDISNIQGEQATGSMVVFINSMPDKNQYRKFRIKKLKTPNDTAMLKEVLERRFNHPEWKYPDAILIDGGKAQLNIAIKVKSQNSKVKIASQNSKLNNIKILAIAKKHNELYIEGREKPIPLKYLPQEIFNLILHIRDESHRFAKSYHKKLRHKQFYSNH